MKKFKLSLRTKPRLKTLRNLGRSLLLERSLLLSPSWAKNLRSYFMRLQNLWIRGFQIKVLDLLWLRDRSFEVKRIFESDFKILLRKQAPRNNDSSPRIRLEIKFPSLT